MSVGSGLGRRDLRNRYALAPSVSRVLRFLKRGNNEMLNVVACITRAHDPWLVGLAAVVCILACYAAINLLRHARGSTGHRRRAPVSAGVDLFRTRRHRTGRASRRTRPCGGRRHGIAGAPSEDVLGGEPGARRAQAMGRSARVRHQGQDVCTVFEAAIRSMCPFYCPR